MKTIKISIIAISVLCYSFSFAQLRVSTTGNTSLGTLNNALTRLQVVGNSLFSSSATPGSNSAAFIRGNNGFSTNTAPDYTWWYNDQCGIFHPGNDIIGFSTNGFERMRIYQGGMLVSGYITANGYYTSSDSRLKTNISGLDDAIGKIKSLKGVRYNYNSTEFKNYNFDNQLQVGFIAQDVLKVLPEAVRQDENGYYSINYSALIPVLVEAIKQQQNQIENLNFDLNNCCKMQSSKNINDEINNSDSPKLYQNNPNPFTQNTEIKCLIPANAKNAGLYIYDMQGTQIKKISLSGKGEVNTTIQGAELKAGMYFYSLIIDGKEIDTKRMILTN